MKQIIPAKTIYNMKNLQIVHISKSLLLLWASQLSKYCKNEQTCYDTSLLIITTRTTTVYSPLSGTTRVSRYQKKYSPTHHPDHHAIFIIFFHLPWSIASSLFKLRAWQSFCTTSFHILFGLPLGLEPSTSYSTHFFTQSVSSFRSTRPYHRNLFCCSINIISSIPSLSLNSLLGTLSFILTLHIHLTIHSHYGCPM